MLLLRSMTQINVTIMRILVTMLFVLSPQIMTGQTQYFSDVQPTAYYFAETSMMYEMKITAGCSPPNLATSPITMGAFCPDQNISREQAAVFLMRAWSTRVWNSAESFRTQATPSYADQTQFCNAVSYFQDVPCGSVYFPYIQKLYELGITGGVVAPSYNSSGVFQKGIFCPNTSDNGSVYPACTGQGNIANYQAAIFINRVKILSDRRCAALYYDTATTVKPFPSGTDSSCTVGTYTWTYPTTSPYFTDVTDGYAGFIQAFGGSGAFRVFAPFNGWAYPLQGQCCVFGEYALTPRKALASWLMNALFVAEPVTITSSPSGLSISVDGTNFTAPQTFSWAAGSVHTIGLTSAQAGGAGTQYVYSNWSDSGAATHAITVPTSSATYTASFTTQYYLSTSAGAGGTSKSCEPMDERRGGRSDQRHGEQ